MAAFSGSKRRNPHCSPESFSSPTPGPSPLSFPLNRPIDRLRNYHAPANLSPNQSPWRSPIQFQSPLSSHTGGTLPDYNPKFNPNSNPNSNSWNKSGDASPSYTHSPHSNSGRGSTWQSRGRGSSSRFVRSGGRGRGFSQDEPAHYYMKTMVKDPWRKLKPVVGNILVPRSGFGSWLPKSIAAPKWAKVVESGTKPLLSLAESLALSLDEALNDV